MGKLAFILGVPVALLATVASLGVVVVDVREGGPDGQRIVVPLPLVLAQAAVAVAPLVSGEKVCVKVDGRDSEETVRIQVPVAVLDALLSGEGEEVNVQAAVDELSKIGKGEIVRIEDEGDFVRVWID